MQWTKKESISIKYGKHRHRHHRQNFRNRIIKTNSVRRSHGKYGLRLVPTGYGITFGAKSAGLYQTVGPRQLAYRRVSRDCGDVPEEIRHSVARNERPHATPRAKKTVSKTKAHTTTTATLRATANTTTTKIKNAIAMNAAKYTQTQTTTPTTTHANATSAALLKAHRHTSMMQTGNWYQCAINPTMATMATTTSKGKHHTHTQHAHALAPFFSILRANDAHDGRMRSSS